MLIYITKKVIRTITHSDYLVNKNEIFILCVLKLNSMRYTYNFVGIITFYQITIPFS